MDKERIRKVAGDERFIVGVYNYCDGWCARCAFTSRCGVYAMGHDEDGGERKSGDLNDEEFWAELGGVFAVTREMIEEDCEEMGIDVDEAIENMGEERDTFRKASDWHPLCLCAKDYADEVRAWFGRCEPVFKAKLEEIRSRAEMGIEGHEPEKDLKGLEEAAEVIRWYEHFIFVKLVRAIGGWLEFGEDGEDYEIYDSQGSAKIALISMDRSIAAWERLLELLPEEEGVILSMLAKLEEIRRGTEELIPGARVFVRPGFDE